LHPNLVMKKLLLLLLLAFAAAIPAVPQSGRRITNPQPTYTPPVQPPVNPQPQPKTAAAPAPLWFLPERLLERNIKGIEKGEFRLADFHGKVVVINLWASWCGPCRREVPDYERVRKSYAGQDVEFVALTLEDPDEAADDVKKFLRQVNFGFRLGWADREMARSLMNGRSGIPQTMVVDTQGRIIKHWTGYAAGRSADRLKDAIEQALPEKTQQ
jgi:thiol-disulfide isomerase/thioredoxin